MYCPKCGYNIKQPDAAFCSRCGAALPAGTAGAGQGPLLSALVERARKQDRQAASELYSLTYTKILYSIRSMVRDEDAVWDILQDTYIQAFRKLGQLEDDTRFLPWLKRIAVNTAKNYLMKDKDAGGTRRIVFFSEFATPEADGTEIVEETFADDRQAVLPEVVIDQNETARLIKEILDALPDEQRLVIGMYYYQEMSVKEIAQALGVTESAVKSRLAYGRKKVETSVLELEKKGTKLYSLAPLPFLLLLFRSLDASAAAPDMEILDGIFAGLNGPASSPLSGTDGLKRRSDPSGTGPMGTASTAAAAAASATGAAGAKTAAIVAAVVIGVSGITAGALHLARQGQDAAPQAPQDTQIATMQATETDTSPALSDISDISGYLDETLGTDSNPFAAGSVYGVNEIHSAYGDFNLPVRMQTLLDMGFSADGTYLSNSEGESLRIELAGGSADLEDTWITGISVDNTDKSFSFQLGAGFSQISCAERIAGCLGIDAGTHLVWSDPDGRVSTEITYEYEGIDSISGIQLHNKPSSIRISTDPAKAAPGPKTVYPSVKHFSTAEQIVFALHEGATITTLNLMQGPEFADIVSSGGAKTEYGSFMASGTSDSVMIDYTTRDGGHFSIESLDGERSGLPGVIGLISFSNSDGSVFEQAVIDSDNRYKPMDTYYREHPEAYSGQSAEEAPDSGLSEYYAEAINAYRSWASGSYDSLQALGIDAPESYCMYQAGPDTGYAFYDCNGDGTSELIIGDSWDNIGAVVAFDGQYYTLIGSLYGNMISIRENGVATLTTYAANNPGTMIEFVRIGKNWDTSSIETLQDGEWDGETLYYCWEGNDISNKKEITKDEYENKKASYKQPSASFTKLK